MLPKLRGREKKDGPMAPREKRHFPRAEKCWPDRFLQAELSDTSVTRSQLSLAVKGPRVEVRRCPLYSDSLGIR